MFRLALALAVLCGAGYGLVKSAHACGTAHRPQALVNVAEESAIILWDSGSQVQHFIRRATFTADTPDFGFLVPTPTLPTLAESKNEVFSFLDKLSEPEVVAVPEYRVVPPIGCGKGNKSMSGRVTVLAQERVAGYDATVLEADSASALNDWLGKYGYVTRPDLTAWLEPYVKLGWKITAFKIARDATRQEIATSAVRMSFSTDKPFFPYSEPADQRDPRTHGDRRLLRVFFVADQRYQGRLGDAQEWSGKTVWAGPLQRAQAQDLVSKLTVSAAGQPMWLTVFEDNASPRGGTADVVFAPSADQDQVRRPPIYYTETHDVGGLLCLGLLLLLPIGGILLRWRRARRAAPPA